MGVKTPREIYRGLGGRIQCKVVGKGLLDSFSCLMLEFDVQRMDRRSPGELGQEQGTHRVDRGAGAKALG